MIDRRGELLVSELIALLLGAGLALLAAPPAGAHEIVERIPVAAAGTLSVELDRGSVYVVSHDSAEIHLEARARGFGASSIHFEIRTPGNDVVLTGTSEEWIGRLASAPTISVRAQVPREYAVEVRTSGGGIEIADIEGRVVARTSGGSIRFEDIEGRVTLETSGGSIVGKAVRGAVSATTSGGRIDLGEVGGDVRAVTRGGRIHLAQVNGDVEAHSSGGPIEIDGVSGAVVAKTSGGSILTRFLGRPSGRVETSGGAIEVAFPSSVGVRLDAVAHGGMVRVEQPLRSRGVLASGRVLGTVNDGGSTLQLRTSGGDIHVRDL